METTSRVRIGSDQWSATMRSEQTERLAAYLDAMATTSKWREGAEHSMALLNLTPGQSVLEVGCGTGVFLPLLAAAVGPGGRVVGIDLSPSSSPLPRSAARPL